MDGILRELLRAYDDLIKQVAVSDAATIAMMRRSVESEEVTTAARAFLSRLDNLTHLIEQLESASPHEASGLIDAFLKCDAE